MQLRVSSAGHAVLGPSVHEVGLVAEVRARVNVPVLSGCHQRVFLAVCGHVGGHALGDGVASHDGQFPALAERGLHIYHD